MLSRMLNHGLIVSVKNLEHIIKNDHWRNKSAESRLNMVRASKAYTKILISNLSLTNTESSER